MIFQDFFRKPDVDPMSMINHNLAYEKNTASLQIAGLSLTPFFVIKAIAFDIVALSDSTFSNIHPINNTLDEIDLCTWTYTARL
jgi:hypothetical protein